MNIDTVQHQYKIIWDNGDEQYTWSHSRSEAYELASKGPRFFEDERWPQEAKITSCEVC